MPSITEMMSTILFELSAILCIVVVTWPTASPPRVAVSDAPTARRLACCALSVLWRTAEVNCSMLDAVVCSEAACCSVREDRSV